MIAQVLTSRVESLQHVVAAQPFPDALRWSYRTSLLDVFAQSQYPHLLVLLMLPALRESFLAAAVLPPGSGPSRSTLSCLSGCFCTNISGTASDSTSGVGSKACKEHNDFTRMKTMGAYVRTNDPEYLELLSSVPINRGPAQCLQHLFVKKINFSPI
jgi:hypothetical protein